MDAMDAIEELGELSEAMRQAAALLADEDVDDNSTSGASSRRATTFLNVVALGNVGAGKSAVLNSLIGHPVLPTGENGATRAPISIDLQRDGSLSTKSIILQIDNKSQQVSASALRHSLQDRLSKGSSGKGRDEIYLKLRTSTAPPLKLVDLPGLDQRAMDESVVSEYAEHNDAILLVIVPAAQAPEIASSRALRSAKEFDKDGTRTIGVISKIDQASSDQKSLAAVQALLLNQGPARASDIPWIALIGQSVSIATAQSGSVGSENSMETAWRAESESLKSILTGAPQSKLGRLALVDALSQQIRKRMKVRLPNLLSGLQGKSQVVQDELVRLGEQMVNGVEGTRALALELCREFEDKFLQHIGSGEGAGWKIVASFEGNFPNRIKQLPLDRHFDINNVKRIVLEADGYQPYLISPEKGLRSLIKGVLELAKEPSRLCVDEVHRVLIDIVSAAANGTPGLGRYPPFKREVVAIASAALDGFKNEAKKMVVALVDMERAFVPPQHFIRLVQRRMERQRREEEVKTRSSKKGQEAEQAVLNRASSPQTNSQQAGGSLKSMKEKPSKEEKEDVEALCKGLVPIPPTHFLLLPPLSFFFRKMALKAVHVSDVPHLDQVPDNASLALYSNRFSKGVELGRKAFRASKFLVIGHRGSGMNALQSSDRRMRAIKENSILSFNAAAKFPIDFVEFDVQVTKDNCPVIFHDDVILSVNEGTVFERRVTELTLAEFLYYGPQQDPQKEGNCLLRKTKDGKIVNWNVETDDKLCTLEEAFQKVESSLGFNIELKFDDHIVYDHGYLTCVLQAVLQVVFENAKERPIIFSTFQPDAALLVRKLQGTYPVFFLTNGGTELYHDVRRNSLEEALKVCLEGGLQGIVSEVKGIFRNPGTVKKIRESELSLLTYGKLNNVAEAVYMQHLMGVDGVIVDLVQEITEAMEEMMIKPGKATGAGEEEGKKEEEGKVQVDKKPQFSERELSFILKLIPELIEL